jgi:sortase (surface protein transpeptidase)
MKKWITLAFASIFAVALSMPAWSQSTTANKSQTATEKKQEKDAKKESAKKKKADKKAAAKKAKDEKQDAAKKDASKK